MTPATAAFLKERLALSAMLETQRKNAATDTQRVVNDALEDLLDGENAYDVLMAVMIYSATLFALVARARNIPLSGAANVLAEHVRRTIVSVPEIPTHETSAGIRLATLDGELVADEVPFQ